MKEQFAAATPANQEKVLPRAQEAVDDRQEFRENEKTDIERRLHEKQHYLKRIQDDLELYEQPLDVRGVSDEESRASRAAWVNVLAKKRQEAARAEEEIRSLSVAHERLSRPEHKSAAETTSDSPEPVFTHDALAAKLAALKKEFDDANERRKNSPIQDKRIAAVLDDYHIEARPVALQPNGLFKEMIVLDKKAHQETEPRIRVYRGVREAGNSLVRQHPYAMRGEDDRGTAGVKIVESVREAVDALAQHPTYENLLAYMEQMRPHWSPSVRARHEASLREIERGLLEGESFRKSLMFQQINHLGGAAGIESDFTPYVSVSRDPLEAMRYAGDQGDLIVMDVPLSQLEFIGDGVEMGFKGMIDDRYISALLPRNGKTLDQGASDELTQVLEQLNNELPYRVAAESVAREVIKKNLEERDKADREQSSADRERLRQEMARRVLERFPFAGVTMSSLESSVQDRDVDVYTRALRRIFDHYAERYLAAVKGKKRLFEEATYSDRVTGESGNFDRSRVTEVMLSKLAHQSERREERAVS